ncbi:hypothetical protein [Litchfieldia salsa]|uniref:Uncharacterized protein n=1 Tax=Litchfieldia salsa TaxID=930152 RepID=A0A1H0VST9_9BACI|nr:hypothetical protein [Litchfieldia salsa]SDP81166.1 hypothetical protein SAMN05216565_107182 [Litchfieldia salsa]
MTNVLKVEPQYVEQQSPKLFEGERILVINGLIGLVLAAVIGIVMVTQGAVRAPEGNLSNAFSFNAALGIFSISIAAILPFGKLSRKSRVWMRWLLVSSSLYAYAVETIQNFRGYNPRYSVEGTSFDAIVGMVFGVVSLVIVFIATWLAIQFFRISSQERPLLIFGVRYALLSVFLANLAGLWMIFLQSRFTGDAGNIIVLHGMGFHALQTLIIPALILEKTQVDQTLKKKLVHLSGIAWLLSLLLIGVQTGLGFSVFELTMIPILAAFLLIVWAGIISVALVFKITKYNE